MEENGYVVSDSPQALKGTHHRLAVEIVRVEVEFEHLFDAFQRPFFPAYVRGQTERYRRKSMIIPWAYRTLWIQSEWNTIEIR